MDGKIPEHLLIILFGLPGVGKSYVANLIARHFGFFQCDGDTYLPSHMKDALLHKQTITDDMRIDFTNNMIDALQQITQNHTHIVFHQTLLKQFMRQRIIDAFPDALFVHVTANKSTRERRYLKRQYFNLGLPYLHHMSTLFENPTTKTSVIENTTNGDSSVIAQINELFDKYYSK